MARKAAVLNRVMLSDCFSESGALSFPKGIQKKQIDAILRINRHVERVIKARRELSEAIAEATSFAAEMVNGLNIHIGQDFATSLGVNVETLAEPARKKR